MSHAPDAAPSAPGSPERGARGAVPPVGAAPSVMPAISVVMPVLNEERHLEEAVGHVLQQDYPAPVEIVLAVGPSRHAELDALSDEDLDELLRAALVQRYRRQTIAGGPDS